MHAGILLIPYTFFYTSWSDSISHIVLPKTFVLLSSVTYWAALHFEGWGHEEGSLSCQPSRKGGTSKCAYTAW
jgi:hypothetical protein